MKDSLSKNLSWHRIFFVLFLLSIPFSIRKIFMVFSVDGSFNEYLDIPLYFSDVLLLITIILFILSNKYELLSITYWRKMFHVEHSILSFVIPLFFITWSGVSIFWSKSQELALYTFIHLILYYFLYIYIIISNVPRGTNSQFMKCSTWNNKEEQKSKMFHVEQNDSKENVPRGTFVLLFINFIEKCSTWNIYKIILSSFIFSGFIQSIIAISQFILQKSIGLSLFRESIISPLIPGVAKVVIGSSTFIRSYGLFPHPNVLGGFLAISLLITIFYPLIFTSKMFHVEQNDSRENVPRGTLSNLNIDSDNKCSTWNKLTLYFDRMFHVEHYSCSYGYKILFFVQFSALLLTFSKTAIIGFFLGLIIAIFNINKMFHVEQNDSKENVPRGTLSNLNIDSDNKCSTWNKMTVKKMFHVEHLFIILGIILSVFIITLFNLKLFIEQSFVERLFFIKSIRELWKTYLFNGLGAGQFVYRMQDFFNEKLLAWQFQPIHNVYLLVFSEVGLIGLALFLWFLIFVFLKNRINVPRGTFIRLAEENIHKCSTWNKMTIKKMFHVEHFEKENDNEGLSLFILLMNSILLTIAFIMFFDHYFWDIQQGQLIFWIILAVAVSNKRY